MTRQRMPAAVMAAFLAQGLATSTPSLAAPRKSDPTAPVVAANAAARIQPSLDTFQGAMQRFAWSEGGLYQVYAAPGRVTDLVLQPGEQLAGPGPIAAGDTARWILGDTESGVGEHRRVHVLVKPTAADLATNLVINTDRRTYYVELQASTATYMASVAWTYPQGSLIAVAKPTAVAVPASQPPVQGLDLAALNFGYRLSGGHPRWRPIQVFDDGRQVFIVFPADIGASDLPPLFVLDEAGRAELVNSRMIAGRMVVDRLFDRAELRLGDKRSKRRVTISRVGVVGR